MNLILLFFGGMPLCHGAGGLTASIIWGLKRGDKHHGRSDGDRLGVFLAISIVGVFTVFSMAIIEAMLLIVGIDSTMFTRDIRPGMNVISLVVTVVISLVSNMAFRFLSGLAVH